MADEKWFLGRVSRLKAEEYLNISGINGSFVIRSSESIAGAYALSVLFNKMVHTYRVLPTDNGMLAVQTLKGVQQRKFTTLSELVREYRNPQNGLICALTNPVGPEPNFTKPSSPNTPIFEASFAMPPRTDALPLLPTSAPTGTPRGSHLTLGVKVLKHGQPDIPPCLPTEKTREVRDRGLPPVPTRDAPQRTAPKPLITQTSTETDKAKCDDSEIKAKFSSRLSEIKASWTTGVNANFFDIVQQYTSDGSLASDISSVRRGGGQCAQLQTLLAREAVGFQSELENFLMKIDVLRQLFDLSTPPRKSHAYNRMQDADVDLDTFLGRLGDCQTVVKSLNMRACINLQELLGLAGTAVARTWPRKSSKTIEPLTERTFEVKQDGALKFTKQKLKVDITKGKLSVIKADGTTEYDHTKVLQLIKNNKSKNKLCIVFDGNKKRDYTFDQSAHREALCQLMQHVRNKHSASTEPDCVSIFCGSWNMGDAIPPADISSWFMCSGSGRCLDSSIQTIPHDIYAIGTQETGLPEKDWMHKVMDTIQEITNTTFHVVAMDALWHIKILILVREEHKHRISHVQTSSVKTGIANALGNKGAVGVSFQFGGTSFCFINAHLTSGSEKCVRRNQNYHDIVRSLNLGEDRLREFDLTNRFDHLYFLGDLNYRLEMDVQEILAHLHRKELGVLAKVDQLRREKDLNKVFAGFDEEEILFPPTYRYERGTRETYSHLKVKKTGIRINVPSWCDRVLWRSYPETHNVCHAYGCSDDIMTSDHSPLFSNFQVGVRGQYVSNEEISSSTNNLIQSSIKFDFVEVILKAPGKSSFYLHFHSVCLTCSVKSNRNSKFETTDKGFNCVRMMWNSESLPQLKPIISDREYLVDQHILVTVKAEDDSEVHGEFVIALRSMIGTSPQNFEDKLTRRGEETGQMRGQMLVKARDYSHAPKEKTYDFIRKDEEEGKRSYQIQDVGLYSDINEASWITAPKQQIRPKAPSPSRPAPSPSEMQKKALSPEVAVYGEAPAGPSIAMESEYANPDEVNNPKPILTIPATSTCGLNNQQPVPGRSSPLVGGSATNHGSPPDQPAPTISSRSKLYNEKEKTGRRSPQNRLSHLPRSNSNSATPTLPNPARHSGSPNRLAQMTDVRRPASGGFLDSEILAEFDAAANTLGGQYNPSPTEAASLQMHTLPPSASSSVVSSSTHANYDTPTSLGIGKVKNIGNTFGGGIPRPSVVPSYKYNTPPGGTRRKASEARGVPQTVEDFLGMINMIQYAPLLQESGWDSIEFLSDITEDDLIDSGITNPQHCRLILERIQSLAL